MGLFNLVFPLLPFLKCLSIRNIRQFSLRAGHISSKAIKMSSAVHIVGQVDRHTNMRKTELGTGSLNLEFELGTGSLGSGFSALSSFHSCRVEYISLSLLSRSELED